ncbi:MAG TPA: OmpA family protein [Candidatus Kryptonia bacterium]|nr:OmpA family protein [Candidatus Kryptonia bacterium]
MKRLSRWVLIALLATPASGTRAVWAEQGVIAGADLGFVGPLKEFKDRSTTGGVLGPFAGYMLNDYVGGVGQVEILGAPNKDRTGVGDNESTWALGAHVGPRLALPFNGGELYATWQGGIFTGLAPQSPIDGTSWGYSTGGGINARITDQLLVGAFLRYNRLDQRVTGSSGTRDDVQYLTGGLSLIYNALPAPPVAPPPPKPVAQAEPAPPPPMKKKIVLRGVNFDFDKSNIRADARPVLNEAIATLKQEGDISIVAEGHTDSRGTEEYNQALSLRRANAVRDYLVAGGVAASRITVEGYGESKPVASNNTDDGRAQNRRVELRIRGE